MQIIDQLKDKLEAARKKKADLAAKAERDRLQSPEALAEREVQELERQLEAAKKIEREQEIEALEQVLEDTSARDAAEAEALEAALAFIDKCVTLAGLARVEAGRRAHLAQLFGHPIPATLLGSGPMSVRLAERLIVETRGLPAEDGRAVLLRGLAHVLFPNVDLFAR